MSTSTFRQTPRTIWNCYHDLDLVMTNMTYGAIRNSYWEGRRDLIDKCHSFNQFVYKLSNEEKRDKYNNCALLDGIIKTMREMTPVIKKVVNLNYGQEYIVQLNLLIVQSAILICYIDDFCGQNSNC